MASNRATLPYALPGPQPVYAHTMTMTAHDPTVSADIATAIAVLQQRLGPRCTTGTALREQHAHTTTFLPAELPDAVAFAESAEEVQEIVRICADHRAPIIPFGTGTSLEGHVNAPLGGISIDLSRMDRVLEVHPEDLDCVVQPGVTRSALNIHLRDTGLFFPVDPGADASLGGMAATRASGTNAVRYGTMRDAVLSLKVVLPSGEMLVTGGRARKSSAGYDLTRLIVGSEGTLGVITELTLRLHGIPEAISAASCSFPDIGAACTTAIETVQCGVPVARMELLDPLSVQAVNAHSNLDLPVAPLLLMEFHGSPASVAEQAETVGALASGNGGAGFDWSADAETRSRLWQARHDAYWALRGLRPGFDIFVTDVCVPVSRLAEVVVAAQTEAESQGLIAPILGHVGDGNFHASLLIDPDRPGDRDRAVAYAGWLSALAIDAGGTCTGEHGIGQGKQAYLEPELGAAAVDTMAAIKQALDPQNIMNPGKIWPG